MINESSKMLLVTGLARGGTTLLAECLNHHPSIMCIADPMNEFFKGFMRFAYYHIEKERKSVGYPIDHFFFSGSLRVSQFIDTTDLKHEIPDFLKNEILTRIAERDGEYCPEIVDAVLKCKAKRFDKLYLEIMQLLYETYGEPGTEWFGIKTTWCEQFLPALQKTFPNMLFINAIRDPRAITASNYVYEQNRYPLLFHVWDWRKSIYYTWKYSCAGQRLSNKFRWVTYEDITDNPEKTLSSVVDLMGLKYDKALLERSFNKSNSSYSETNHDASGGITKLSKEKWKAILPRDIVLLLETYCAAEMKKLKYEPLYPNSSMGKSDLLSLEDIPYESLSSWCKDIVQSKKAL